MSANLKWKIVRPEPDERAVGESESDLSPQMQAIAERLTAEATELAEHFPASTPRLVERNASTVRLRFAAALFGAAVAGASLGWWLHRSHDVLTVQPGIAVANNSQTAVPQTPLRFSSTVELWQSPTGVQEVGYLPADPKSSKLSELEMLRIQLSAFEQVIRRLQDELNRREKSETETTKTIELLSREIEQLRHLLQSNVEPQQAADSAAAGRVD
jgi:hypothetical protein